MFTYEYTASQFGVVYETAVVDEKGAWGDFKQSHADMALYEEGVLFDDLEPGKYVLTNTHSQSHVYAFVTGEFEKRPKQC